MLRTRGEVAERLKAAVLKTVDRRRSGGSNPPLSAISILDASVASAPAGTLHHHDIQEIAFHDCPKRP